MKSLIIPLLLAALISGIGSAAEGNPSRQEIEAMLGKKGSYEYNLVGKRLLRPINETLLKRLLAQAAILLPGQPGVSRQLRGFLQGDGAAPVGNL